MSDTGTSDNALFLYYYKQKDTGIYYDDPTDPNIEWEAGNVPFDDPDDSLKSPKLSIAVSEVVYDLLVNGFTGELAEFNGQYAIVDGSATGKSRAWQLGNTKLMFDNNSESWEFKWNNEKYYCYALGDDPWGKKYYLWDETTYNETTIPLTVEQVVSNSSNSSTEEQQWLGNKLILATDSENVNKKYYTFSNEITSGLTYGLGYEPVLDEVYNADATIKATNLFVNTVQYNLNDIDELSTISNDLPIIDTNISNEPIGNVETELTELNENFKTLLG